MSEVARRSGALSGPGRQEGNWARHRGGNKVQGAAILLHVPGHRHGPARVPVAAAAAVAAAPAPGPVKHRRAAIHSHVPGHSTTIENASLTGRDRQVAQ